MIPQHFHTYPTFAPTRLLLRPSIHCMLCCIVVLCCVVLYLCFPSPSLPLSDLISWDVREYLSFLLPFLTPSFPLFFF